MPAASLGLVVPSGRGLPRARASVPRFLGLPVDSDEQARPPVQAGAGGAAVAGRYLPDLLAEGNRSSLGDHEPGPLGPPATEGTPSAVLGLLSFSRRRVGCPLPRGPRAAPLGPIPVPAPAPSTYPPFARTIRRPRPPPSSPMREGVGREGCMGAKGSPSPGRARRAAGGSSPFAALAPFGRSLRSGSPPPREVGFEGVANVETRSSRVILDHSQVSGNGRLVALAATEFSNTNWSRTTTHRDPCRLPCQDTLHSGLAETHPPV